MTDTCNSRVNWKVLDNGAEENVWLHNLLSSAVKDILHEHVIKTTRVRGKELPERLHVLYNSTPAIVSM